MSGATLRSMPATAPPEHSNAGVILSRATGFPHRGNNGTKGNTGTSERFQQLDP